jgi:hypothetical protein
VGALSKEGKNDVSLLVIIRLSVELLLLYAGPGGGEFASRENGFHAGCP